MEEQYKFRNHTLIQRVRRLVCDYWQDQQFKHFYACPVLFLYCPRLLPRELNDVKNRGGTEKPHPNKDMQIIMHSATYAYHIFPVNADTVLPPLIKLPYLINGHSIADIQVAYKTFGC
jgi:hypothetical protein